ncbi:MAG: universal stress protein [Gemmatimonadaceae bacterium]
MRKVIMVPTEGSDSERPAIALAVKLAQRFDAELRLVRVETPPFAAEAATAPPVLLITEGTLRDARLARRRKLEAMGADWSKLTGIDVTTALEDGPVGPTLVAYAERFGVDWIVMSSHCRGGLKRMTLGSVTDYLIRHSNVPVIVSKQEQSPVGVVPDVFFGRIVVPLDGSTLAEEILPRVAELASPLNSTVSLLHVLTPVTYSQNAIMQPGLPWWDNDIAKAEAYLADASVYLTERGLTVSKEVVLSDDIATAIIDYLVRSRADLVAIATRGIGGMSRLVFGTVADKVTRQSPTSVLVFHPDPAHNLVRDDSHEPPGAKATVEA